MSDFLPDSKSPFNGTLSIQLKLLGSPDRRTPSPTTSQGDIGIYIFLK